MKNLKLILVLMLFATSLSFSQKLKITGGVNLMDINYAITSPDIDFPIDEPTDGPTDLPAKSISTKSTASFNNTSTASSMLSNKTTNNETGFYLGLALTDITLFNNFELQPEVRFVGVKDFNQIQVPVLLSYGITEKFHAFAGPNFAFLLDTGDGVESFNFALDFGLSYDISKKIALDARYDWGQTNLLDRGDSDNYIKINNIQFGLTYKLGK